MAQPGGRGGKEWNLGGGQDISIGEMWCAADDPKCSVFATGRDRSGQDDSAFHRGASK